MSAARRLDQIEEIDCKREGNLYSIGGIANELFFSFVTSIPNVYSLELPKGNRFM
jgi:hypothetical protein